MSDNTISREIAKLNRIDRCFREAAKHNEEAAKLIATGMREMGEFREWVGYERRPGVTRLEPARVLMSKRDLCNGTPGLGPISPKTLSRWISEAGLAHTNHDRDLTVEDGVTLLNYLRGYSRRVNDSTARRSAMARLSMELGVADGDEKVRIEPKPHLDL